jgi:hypothetical protein
MIMFCLWSMFRSNACLIFLHHTANDITRLGNIILTEKNYDGKLLLLPKFPAGYSNSDKYKIKANRTWYSILKVDVINNFNSNMEKIDDW